MNSIKHCITTVALGLLLFISSESYAAVKFTIRSQNFLHLGWGVATVTANKCKALGEMMATNDVIIVQELMQATDPCATQTATNNFQFIANATGLGTSTYKEFYGFYIKSAKVTYTGTMMYATGNFERPPHAIGLRITQGTSSKYIWVGNIHSIFGKKVAQRYAEATLAGSFYTALLTTPMTGAPATPFPVIIGGDWNIPLKKKNNTYTTGFTWMAGQLIDGSPNAATSISLKGKRASAYDHFIYTSSLTINNVKLETSPSFASDLSWRQNVTDHLGISAEVTIP